MMMTRNSQYTFAEKRRAKPKMTVPRVRQSSLGQTMLNSCLTIFQSLRRCSACVGCFSFGPLGGSFGIRRRRSAKKRGRGCAAVNRSVGSRREGGEGCRATALRPAKRETRSPRTASGSIVHRQSGISIFTSFSDDHHVLMSE